MMRTQIGRGLCRAAAWGLLVAVQASSLQPTLLAASHGEPAAAQDAAPAGLPRAAAESVGMDADRLAEIAPRMQQFVDQQQIAGAVTLVARDGKVVHLAAVGDADREGHRPMREDTLFGIASMSKPITATALMMLVDAGKVSLDDPVSRYLPEFKSLPGVSGRPAREVTLRDIATHTSGMGGNQVFDGSLADAVREIAHRRLSFEPGTKWQYSPGLTVAGRVVEVVAGQPFEEFLAARIFQPLGMRDTTFKPTAEQLPRLARVYRPARNDPGIEPTTPSMLDQSIPRGPNPSAGLFSTASDLARFYQAILNGGELDGARILSAAAVAEMTKVQRPDVTTGFTPGNGWGIGWCIVREPQGVTRMLSPGTFGHGGAFGTQGWIDPVRRMVFVLMIQREGLPNSDASPMRESLQQLAVEAITNR